MRRVILFIAVLLAGTVLAGVNDGLVGHWKFDLGRGEKVVDATANANNGTLKGGAGWTTEGLSGCAVLFNGTTSCVEIPTSKTMDLKTLTMSAWVKAAAVGGIMSFSTGSAWIDERAVIHFYASKGKVQFTVSNGDKFVTSAGSAAMPLNEWVHVAVPYDGKAMRTYQNGAVHAEAANAAISPNTKGVALQIGRCQGLHPNFFKGAIDEVRLYNRGLNAAEIAELAKEFPK